MANKLEGDWHFTGTVTGFAIYPTANTVQNAQIHPSADITAEKMRHRFRKTHAQAKLVAPTAGTYLLHHAGAVGALESFEVRMAVAVGGSSTVTFDLHNNGVSVLSAPVTIVTADGTAFKAGTISVPAYAAGDILEVVVASAGGSPGTGPGVSLEVTELP
jgi:hypothetical protein